MRNAAQYLAILALATLAACGEDNALAPQPDLAFNNTAGHGARSVRVMTRNLYIGTDVDAAMAALATPDPADDMPALLVALQTLQVTDFATRIRAIAREIAANRPDVVGLQEVYDLYVTPAALGLPGDPIEIHFLPALQAALTREHVRYEVAARNTATDASIAGGAVHIIDHDVLLVNTRTVTLTEPPVEALFSANIGPVAEGITLQRGYVARRATVDGTAMLLVNTHLESGEGADYEGLRAMQAGELATFIGTDARVVLTGDFNGVPGTMMYGILSSAQLTDTWAALRPRAPGFSCCQASDLSNRRSQLDQRIDFIWTRGFTRPSGKLDGEIELVAAHPRDLVRGAYGWIWPSDHAGLVAEVEVPRPEIRH